MKTIAAMVLNDKGDLLPYTCRHCMEACEEEMPEVFTPYGWEQMKVLGAKVVQVEISTLEEVVDPRLKDWPASTEASRQKAYREGWENGYLPGLEKGIPNPYPTGTDEDKEWLSGHAVGSLDAYEAWGD